MSESAAASRHCAICMTAVAPEDAATPCRSCGAEYHAECWADNGGCAIYGCNMVPKTEGLKALEIPPAFWGRENKDCPKCGQQILAMAVRCRFCGAQVEAKIEERAAYEKREARVARAPRLKQWSLVLLVLSLLPVLSVVPAIFGTFYYRANREEIRRMRGSYDGYYRIAIVVGFAQLVIVAVALTAWWVKFEILNR